MREKGKPSVHPPVGRVFVRKEKKSAGTLESK